MSPIEIDALVAEHCMGYVWMQGDGNNNLLHPEDAKKAASFGMYPGRNPDRKSTVTRFTLPLFSTDLAASKKLRDKMRADGWWCQTRNGWTLDDPNCWAGFTPHGVTGWNGQPDNWTEADTEEMAVALAALSAVGKPVAP